MAQFMAQVDASPAAGPETVGGKGYETLQFEKTLQGALKTLSQSLDEHVRLKRKYQHTISRLNEVLQNVPPESKLPLGEILGFLRNKIPIDDLSPLLSLDLRTRLSPSEVADTIREAKRKNDSEIEEIHKEIAEMESMSILKEGEKEVLNEEGLPIKEIMEEVFDEEGRRAVLPEEEFPTRVYTMEEIDKMMDEAMAEEQAEMMACREESLERKPERQPAEPPVTEDVERRATVIAVAGQGLGVGQVSGEELLAKVMDESGKRYDPVTDTWIEDESDGAETDDENQSEDGDDEEEDEEEDQYGRTRGYLIPPNLSKGIEKGRGVKFAAFEQPATPSTFSSDGPPKSVLKTSGHTLATGLPAQPPAVPVTSSRAAQVMTSSVVEKSLKQDTQIRDTKASQRISRFKASRQGV